MEKELTSAEKSRKTKLSKKNVEDLVNIIIRKDDVERRKDKLIACLKTNIAGLENKVSSIQRDLLNAETEYGNTAKKYNTVVAIAQHKQDDIDRLAKTLETNNKLYKDKFEVLQEEHSKANLKVFALGMFIGGIVFAIMHYLV